MKSNLLRCNCFNFIQKQTLLFFFKIHKWLDHRFWEGNLELYRSQLSKCETGWRKCPLLKFASATISWPSVISISTITLESTFDHCNEPPSVNWITLSSNSYKGIWYNIFSYQVGKIVLYKMHFFEIPEHKLMWFKMYTSKLYSLKSEQDPYLSLERWHK